MKWFFRIKRRLFFIFKLLKIFKVLMLYSTY